MKSLCRDFRLIQKGLKEIHRIRPKLLTFLFIRSLFQALSPFINIYMSARILNGISAGESLEFLLLLAALTVGLNVLVLLISYGLNHIVNLFQAEFGSLYEMRLSLKITELDYANVESADTHMLRQKIQELKNLDGSGIWRLLSSFPALIKNAASILFAVSLTFTLFFTAKPTGASGPLAFVLSPWASLLLVAFIFANVWVNMYANAAVTRKMYAIMNGMIPFNRVFGYYMGNYISTYHAGKDIRIYHQENLIASETDRLFTDFRTVANHLSRNQIRFSTLTSVSTVVISTLIYLFVGLKALAGLFGVGMILQYVSSINEFTNGFTGFMGELSKLRANNEAMNVYFEFMSIPACMNEGTRIPDKNPHPAEIEFRNVSFHYPGSDVEVLKHLNVRLGGDKRISIVGENGSGKTTMIKLLCRLYDPTEGEIRLNGVDIRQYDYAEYQKLFSVVFQDFKLFSFSLAENVAVASEYEPDRVEDCLTKAGFHERLAAMPAGIDTHLYKDFDENGVEVSGGEAQKITLARAIYKDSPFVVLDEPTAALDPIAEEEIYTHFQEIVGNKTAVFISHRLSSCRFCDRIFVLDKGELIQQGNHDDLLRDTQGKYYELWNAQAQYYAEAKG